MKLSEIALETLSNLRASPKPLTPAILLEKSNITQHSRRLGAALILLEDMDLIYIVVDTNSIAGYNCEYGVRGIHDIDDDEDM